MPKREPILDDPEVLARVMESFKKWFPPAAEALDDKRGPMRGFAIILWSGYKQGFEDGYWADEEPLHSG